MARPSRCQPIPVALHWSAYRHLQYMHSAHCTMQLPGATTLDGTAQQGWIDGYWVNSMGPGLFGFNFKYVIFKLILVNDDWGIPYEIALRWMPQDLADDKSALVQVMAWCRQATSHYLSQCWPRPILPNGVTRPQWVNSLGPGRSECSFKNAIFNLIFLLSIFRFPYDDALRIMPLDVTDK